jgi:hypothetical protein
MIALLCLSFLGGSGMGGTGGVLCVGSDDRMKVEAVCEPCCGDSDDGCLADEIIANPEMQEPCHSCTDIPIACDVLSVRQFGLDDIDVPLVTDIPPFSTSGAIARAGHSRAISPVCPRPRGNPFAGLSAIILIC